MELLTVLGVFSNFFTIMFLASPVTIMIQLYKDKDTSKIPYLLFLFTDINCLFWFIYGVKINSWPIYSNNLFGLTANVFYLIMFINYVDSLSASVKSLLNIVVVIFNLATFGFFHLYVENAEISGSIAMVFNIIMNISQLQKIREVVTFKDNSYIPLFTVTSLFLQSLLWMFIGVLSDYNLYIILPNLLGTALALLQIVLWFAYNNPKSTKHECEVEKDEKAGFI